LSKKPCHVDEVARGQDVDDLVVLDVGHGRGVTRVVTAQLHEAGLVEADGAGAIEPLRSASSSASP
jgi:hypothetical protein